MIIPVIARDAGRRAPPVPGRFEGWEAAIIRVREERPDVLQLPDLLAEVPEADRDAAFQDLLAAHMEVSRAAGHGELLERAVAPLVARFPWLSPDRIPAELVEDEFLARHRPPHGDHPAIEEYARRFPGRADVASLLSAREFGGGKFVTLKRIGAGATGEVREAWDRGRGRLVAIKRPVPGTASRERFGWEAEATAGLEHPGIGSVEESGVDESGAPFHVVRLVAGPLLSERIAEHHRAPGEGRRRLLEIIAACCDAMEHAHSRGVIHRDLKPGNIRLGADGAPVILDWGMAGRLAADGSSARGLILGTPESMPPEQADGVSDVRSDVFGLGAVLYEVLAGRPPHDWPDGIRPADWRPVVRRAAIAAPRAPSGHTPRDLQAICLRALARDPAHRYPSAAELGADLRRHLAGEPVRASRTFAPAWLRRWLGR